MKKHRGMKITLIVAMVFVIIGAILVGAGIAKGGSLRYLSVNSQTASWWPFHKASVGIGGSFDDDDNNAKKVHYDKSFETVRSLQVDVGIADIEIRKGNENRIVYRSNRDDDIKVSNKDGALTLVIKNDKIITNNSASKLIIYLKDATYEKLFIDIKIGDIDIIDFHAKDIEIYSKLGDIDMEGLYSERLMIDQKCGDIDVEGQLLQTTTIHNKLGDTEVNIRGNREDYRYEINNNLGDSEILGMEKEYSAKMTGGNSQAKHFVQIDNTMGDLEFSIY